MPKRDSQRSKVYAFDKILAEAFESPLVEVRKKARTATFRRVVPRSAVKALVAEGWVVDNPTSFYPFDDKTAEPHISMKKITVYPAHVKMEPRPIMLAEMKKVAEWACARYHTPGKIDVFDGRRCRFARGSWNSMVMPRWARYPQIVAHEIAHVVAERLRYGSKHDEFYVRVYCDLVGKISRGPKAIQEIMCPKGPVDVADFVRLARAAKVKVASVQDLQDAIATKKENKARLQRYVTNRRSA